MNIYSIECENNEDYYGTVVIRYIIAANNIIEAENIGKELFKKEQGLCTSCEVKLISETDNGFKLKLV